MSFASAGQTPDTSSTPLLAKFREFCRLIGVVLLQDMRTRYGGSYFGYLIAIAFPLGHMALLSLAYILRTQIAPVGDSPAMFVGTGVVPYILCLYPARTMQLAILQNRQLLNIPMVQPLHLIICRCILSMLNGIIVLFVFMYTCYLFDVDFLPYDLVEASKAVVAAIFLGVGLGFLNVVMCAIFGHFFVFVFIGLMIILYTTSGVYIPLSAMPDAIRDYLVYNPLLNIVEWLRSAYFASYDAEAIDRPLIFGVSSISLALGLVGERFLRGKFFS